MTTVNFAAAEQETKGVWVSYMTLDVETAANKESAFQNKITKILTDMRLGGFNTMIVQVRPFSDALYRSKVFPWSHILSGHQGENPGFDPLEWICKAAHQQNIAVHAWINPYRVKTAETPQTLSENHPYRKDPTIGFEVDGAIYLDPSSEKAKKLIVAGVNEIVKNYDVDGIQFDDYFYPETDEAFDEDPYREYCDTTEKPMTLSVWRKENVNDLIHRVWETVHSVGKAIVFGISPQGNLKNNDALGADVIKWCAEEGYIDYICPQIYFSLDNPSLTFESSLEEWTALKRHDHLRLYVGLAGYKGGTDADENTWEDNDDILKTEIEILRAKKTDGFMLYSYESFHDPVNSEEIQNVMNYLSVTEDVLSRSSPTQ